jgi:uncharacterized protein with GYD domain
MSDYVVLMKITEKGAADIRFTPAWVRKVIDIWESRGGTVRKFFVTMGDHDFVALTEAPDQETAARLALLLAETGAVTVTTLPAFGYDEFAPWIENLGEVIDRPPKHPLVPPPQQSA